MASMTITDSNFNEFVLQSDKPVLLYFWATWSGPCKMVGPIIEELSTERTDINMANLDADNLMNITSDYNVTNIPSMIIFKGGQAVSTSIGTKPKSVINDWIDETINA